MTTNVVSSLTTIPGWLQKNWEDMSHDHLPDWLVTFRWQQWYAFMQGGLPTQKNEEWKYANLQFLQDMSLITADSFNAQQLKAVIHQHRLQRGESILLVLVNGHFMPSLSDMMRLPPDIIACGLQEALAQHEDLIKSCWLANQDKQTGAFVRWNAAMATDGLFLSIKDDGEFSTPIHLLSLAIGGGHVAHPRHTILLGHHSKLTLVEEHFSLVDVAYMANIVTTIFVGEKASLQYYKIQQEGSCAVHMAHTFIRQMQYSHVALTHFSSGATFARDNVAVSLQGQGSVCSTGGFYWLNAKNQYIDHHIDIDHVASCTQSEMHYKGILDQQSRAVFNGRLHVLKDAQKISAYQANHHLLLSKEAEVYTKPTLEIYADDVKCKHGATVGQLDQAALFYMRSRGISLTDAMNILLQGFSEDIFQRVKEPGIKMRVQEMSQFL